MSLWGFDGEDNALNTWSSLTQFDDMVWNEFGETNGGDHVVPNPASPQNTWFPNGDRVKRTHREPSFSESSIKEESTTSTGMADSVAEMSSDGEDGSKEVLLLRDTTSLPSGYAEGGWTDPSAESEPFGSDQPPASQETEDDTGDEGINDHQSIVNEGGLLFPREENSSMGTAPFSISDVDSQDGGLEMFGNENVASKADSLLELGWENIGNLDDMDKLFRNNDTSFEPVMVNGTDGLDWPSSSSPPGDALDSGMQFEKTSSVPGTTSVKVELDAVEDKTELVFGDCLPGLVMGSLDDVVPDSGSPRSLSISAGAPVQQHKLLCTDERGGSCKAKSLLGVVPGAKKTKEVTGISSGSFPEVEKVSLAQVYRARRQAANRKRSEDRFKRTTSYRKLSPGPPYNVPRADVRHLQSLPLRLPGQAPHLQPTSAYSLQFFPPSMTPGLISAHQSHGVPYIHVGYPLCVVPGLSCSPSTHMIHMQHPQPMFGDHQQSGSPGQRQPVLLHQPSPLASSQPLDASSRPPTSNPHMSPQEKLEKLRWRQQMQARMAVEQQQQLLTSKNGEGVDATVYHKQKLAMSPVLLPSQPGIPLTPTSEHLMNLPAEADQRVIVAEGDVLARNDREEVEDYSLEGSVLSQLKSTVSALDINTRLCIRDALYRLARSATKRRAAGSDSVIASRASEDHESDGNAVESSTASGPPLSHSRATSMSVVEAETNPIDRSIAKLLFSKPQPPMYVRPHMYT